jgi:hypothetical protein
MENTVVVGFGYKARNGKDEAVKAIIAARAGQYDVRRYAFADVLKREVNEAAVAAGGMLELFKQGGVWEETEYRDGPGTKLVEFPSWVQYDPDADMTDPLCPLGKQRTLLQWWGTEFRRARDNNYWVKKMDETLRTEKPRIALITDMRFPNEVSWVKQDPASGFVVRVDRLGYKTDVVQHVSEKALDFMGDEDWHYIIQVNDGDVEELKRDAVVVFDLIVELLTPPDLSDLEVAQQLVSVSTAS